jgi:cation transport ATPase
LRRVSTQNYSSSEGRAFGEPWLLPVEANSEHPLAKAIVAEAKRRTLPRLRAADFEELPGRGARALVDGKSIVPLAAR